MFSRSRQRCFQKLSPCCNTISRLDQGQQVVNLMMILMQTADYPPIFRKVLQFHRNQVILLACMFQQTPLNQLRQHFHLVQAVQPGKKTLDLIEYGQESGMLAHQGVGNRIHFRFSNMAPALYNRVSATLAISFSEWSFLPVPSSCRINSQHFLCSSRSRHGCIGSISILSWRTERVSRPVSTTGMTIFWEVHPVLCSQRSISGRLESPRAHHRCRGPGVFLSLDLRPPHQFEPEPRQSRLNTANPSAPCSRPGCMQAHHRLQGATEACGLPPAC
jgi:hypothetical protein